MKTKDLVYQAARWADDKKATDIEILDISNIADIADYVVLCSGSSPAQLKAIARHIEDSISSYSMEPVHKEGKYGAKWYLLDYLDFVVHVIDEESRSFYNLEELWQEAIFIPEPEWQDNI